MVKTRAARTALDEAFQGLIGASAATISAEGRRKLAEGPPNSRNQNR
jgi:hypothetical protein